MDKKENVKILLVEDDEAIAFLLKQILELENYNVHRTCNGQEALDYLKTDQSPQVILLDLTMPVMGGLEFRRRQMAEPSISSIPVLLMTADGQASADNVFFKLESFLKKPLSIDDVLLKVRVALETKLK